MSSEDLVLTYPGIFPDPGPGKFIINYRQLQLTDQADLFTPGL